MVELIHSTNEESLSMGWTSHLAAIAAAGALASSMIAPASGDTARGDTAPGEPPRSGPVAVDTVTLITGDKVVLQRYADGRQAATVDAARGREHIAFRSVQTDGKLRVIPSDAAGHLAAVRSPGRRRSLRRRGR